MNGTGYTYLVHYNPAHKWYYLPEMQADEVALIKASSCPVVPQLAVDPTAILNSQCYDNKLPRAIAPHSG